MTEVAVMDEDWKSRAEKAEAERAEARAELQRQQRLRVSEAGKYLGDVAALRGEAERLRRQLEDWKHSLVEQEKVSEAFMCERDALRAEVEALRGEVAHRIYERRVAEDRAAAADAEVEATRAELQTECNHKTDAIQQLHAEVKRLRGVK